MKRTTGIKAVAVAMVAIMLMANAALFLKAADSSDADSEKKEIIYVSLGDSMVNGYGMQEYYPNDTDNYYGFLAQLKDGETNYVYPFMLVDYLEEQGYDVDYRQIAVSGMRTMDLWGLLDEEFQKKYAEVDLNNLIWEDQAQAGASKNLPAGYTNDLAGVRKYTFESIAAADLITYQYHYDFSRTLSQLMDKLFAGQEYNPNMAMFMDPFMTEGIKEIEAKVAELIKSLIGDDPMYPLMANGLINGICFSVAMYCVSFDNNIRIIHDLNPDVKIVVLDSYNSMGDLTLNLNGIRVPLGLIYDGVLEYCNIYTKYVSPYAVYTYHVDINEKPMMFKGEFTDKDPADISQEAKDVCSKCLSQYVNINEIKGVTDDMKSIFENLRWWKIPGRGHELYEFIDVNGDLSEFMKYVFESSEIYTSYIGGGGALAKAKTQQVMNMFVESDCEMVRTADGMTVSNGTKTVEYNNDEMFDLFINFFSNTGAGTMAHPCKEAHVYLYGVLEDFFDETNPLEDKGVPVNADLQKAIGLFMALYTGELENQVDIAAKGIATQAIAETIGITGKINDVMATILPMLQYVYANWDYLEDLYESGQYQPGVDPTLDQIMPILIAIGFSQKVREQMPEIIGYAQYVSNTSYKMNDWLKGDGKEYILNKVDSTVDYLFSYAAIEDAYKEAVKGAIDATEAARSLIGMQDDLKDLIDAMNITQEEWDAKVVALNEKFEAIYSKYQGFVSEELFSKITDYLMQFEGTQVEDDGVRVKAQTLTDIIEVAIPALYVEKLSEINAVLDIAGQYIYQLIEKYPDQPILLKIAEVYENIRAMINSLPETINIQLILSSVKDYLDAADADLEDIDVEDITAYLQGVHQQWTAKAEEIKGVIDDDIFGNVEKVMGIIAMIAEKVGYEDIATKIAELKEELAKVDVTLDQYIEGIIAKMAIIDSEQTIAMADQVITTLESYLGSASGAVGTLVDYIETIFDAAKVGWKIFIYESDVIDPLLNAMQTIHDNISELIAVDGKMSQGLYNVLVQIRDRFGAILEKIAEYDTSSLIAEIDAAQEVLKKELGRELAVELESAVNESMKKTIATYDDVMDFAEYAPIVIKMFDLDKDDIALVTFMVTAVAGKVSPDAHIDEVKLKAFLEENPRALSMMKAYIYNYTDYLPKVSKQFDPVVDELRDGVTYYITLNVSGVETVKACKIGDIYDEAPAAPEGKHFVGWATVPDGKATIIGPITVEGDKTYYAVFEDNGGGGGDDPGKDNNGSDNTVLYVCLGAALAVVLLSAFFFLRRKG